MNDHDLDLLIRDALQSEAPADQLQRLEQFWRRQLVEDRRHRRTFAVALAASLALVATGVVWLLNQTNRPQLDQRVENAAPTKVNPPQPPTDKADQGAQDSRRLAASAGRPATAYELVMFQLSVAQAAKTEAAIVELNPEATVQQLEQRVGLAGLPEVALTTPYSAVRTAIFRRLLEADDDVALRGYLSLVANEFTRSEALATADHMDHPPAGALLSLLRDESKTVRTSAAVALGRINGPEVTAALIELVTQDRAAPAEAWIALLACRGDPAEEFIADAAHHPRMLGRLNNARIFWQTIQ